MNLPASLSRDISPPRAGKRRKLSQTSSLSSRGGLHCDARKDPTLAAVEAGRAKVEDHLTYFKHHLAKASRTTPESHRLSLGDFASLYKNNQHDHGRHFVIHQHNHPKAGVHYDLRLQFSLTSSVSWAFPKGLPGNPNCRQQGRMAVETRVHNLWNNLIESASMETGSLLIWDTGTYTILPRKKDEKGRTSPRTTDDESDVDRTDPGKRIDKKHENEKLIEAFKARHIRLRLNGTRLPNGYTITLRLPSNNDISHKPAARRRKSKPVPRGRQPSHTSDSESAPTPPVDSRQPSTVASTAQKDADVDDLDTDLEEDTLTRAQNAYPGATNSIGSVHQRRWYALLDRQSSGFELSGGTWVRGVLPNGDLGGFEAFVVRGREHERSVVTGRLARDVERDEGCEAYVGRAGWRSVG